MYPENIVLNGGRISKGQVYVFLTSVFVDSHFFHVRCAGRSFSRVQALSLALLFVGLSRLLEESWGYKELGWFCAVVVAAVHVSWLILLLILYGILKFPTIL